MWTQDKPNPNPNPNTEKQNKFLKKARELASVSLINQSKMTQKDVGRSHKLVKDETKSFCQILVDVL